MPSYCLMNKVGVSNVTAIIGLLVCFAVCFVCLQEIFEVVNNILDENNIEGWNALQMV